MNKIINFSKYLSEEELHDYNESSKLNLKDAMINESNNIILIDASSLKKIKKYDINNSFVVIIYDTSFKKNQKIIDKLNINNNKFYLIINIFQEKYKTIKEDVEILTQKEVYLNKDFDFTIDENIFVKNQIMDVITEILNYETDK